MSNSENSAPDQRRGRPFQKGISGNPKGRPRRTDSQPVESPEARAYIDELKARLDDWQNMVTGVGVVGRDKRKGGAFVLEQVTSEQGLELWLGDDLAARIVEELPSEALRQGVTIVVGDNVPTAQELKGTAGEPAPGEKPPFGAEGGAAEPDDADSKEPGAKKAPPFGAKRKRADAPVKRKPFGENAPDELDEEPEADLDEPLVEGAENPDVEPMALPGESAEGEDSKAVQEWIGDELERLGAFEKLERAACLERATCGSAILLGALDPSSPDLRQPLTLEGVRDFKWMTVVEVWEISPATYYTNPQADKFWEVETWNITVSQPGTPGPTSQKEPAKLHTVEVHESRLVIFEGIKVSRRQAVQHAGFGDNIFTRLWPVLRDFNNAFSSAGVLVQDFAQAIWAIKGLAELIALDKSDAFKKRVQAMELARTSLGAVAIDAEGEQFERKATPVTGLPELLDRFERRLSAATGIPLTRLMGMSPGGLNATGAADMAFFYDNVQRYRKRKLEPALKRIVELLLRAGGKKVDSWSIRWPSLYQATALEDAQLRKTVAETDQINIAAGLYTAEEAAVSHYAGDEFDPEIHLDFSARAMAERQEAQLQAQEAELRVAEASGFGAKPGEEGPPKGPPGAAKPPPFGRKDAFSEDQPRDEFGRWTSGGAGSAKAATPEGKAKREERVRAAGRLAATKFNTEFQIQRREGVRGPVSEEEFNREIMSTFTAASAAEEAAIVAEDRAADRVLQLEREHKVAPIPTAKLEAYKQTARETSINLQAMASELDDVQSEAATELHELQDAYAALADMSADEMPIDHEDSPAASVDISSWSSATQELAVGARGTARLGASQRMSEGERERVEEVYDYEGIDRERTEDADRFIENLPDDVAQDEDAVETLRRAEFVRLADKVEQKLASSIGKLERVVETQTRQLAQAKALSASYDKAEAAIFAEIDDADEELPEDLDSDDEAHAALELRRTLEHTAREEVGFNPFMENAPALADALKDSKKALKALQKRQASWSKGKIAKVAAELRTEISGLEKLSKRETFSSRMAARRAARGEQG